MREQRRSSAPLRIVAVAIATLIATTFAFSPRIAGSAVSPPLANSPETTIFEAPFVSLDGWTAVGGATFDASVTANPGSGSARLETLLSAIRSSPVPAESGALYFTETQIRQDSWPRGNVTISIQQTTADGAWIANLPVETATAPFVNGQFSRSGLYFVVPPGVQFFQVVLIRSAEQASLTPMWVDDVRLTKNPPIRTKRTNKTPFNGSQTRIDQLGNWDIKVGTSWTPWFPLCVAINPSRTAFLRLRSIQKQGFNCNIWNGHDVASLQNHKAAGLRSFFQLAQYTNPKGWAVGDDADLQAKIAAANASPASDYLAGYYLDNENQPGNVAITKRITDTVKATDIEPTSGVRRRPILHLQGSYGSLGMWSDEQGAPFTDAVGAYVPAVNSGGAGSAPGAQLFLESQLLQSQPSAYCQINDGIGIKFRAALFSCIAQGSRALSFWGDGPTDAAYPDVPDLELQPFWPDMPAIARDLNELAPVLQASNQTDWSATLSGNNDLLPVIVGTRTSRGIGHLILSNVADSPQRRSIRLEGLPYRAAEVRDYFTDALVTSVGDSQTFDVTVPAAGIGSGALVLRVVPKGWKPPARPTTSAAPKPVAKVTTKKSPRASAAAKSKPAAAPIAQRQTTAPPKTASTATAATITAKAAGRATGELCRAGIRLQAEAARIPVGTVPVSVGGDSRTWLSTGAPSALNWPVATTGKLAFRFRYIKKTPGDALRTIFAVRADGTWVSRQFALPTTNGSWGVAEVKLDAPKSAPLEISASFDVLTDRQDIDALDFVDVCPIAE